MAEEFVKSVEDGIKLSKRIYFGKDRNVTPPRAISIVSEKQQQYLPASPMMYGVISDPSIVDNPDIPSYQPHVHGRCDPPALIPLQMNSIEMEVNVWLDTVFVSMIGSWRVHCVMGSRSCDCRIAIPMGNQGSILGVEVEVNRRSFHSQLTSVEDTTDCVKLAKVEDGGFLKPNIFTLTIPQIDGGANISVKANWSQKLAFDAGQFTVNIPFSFPEYVTPAGKKIAKREKIKLNVNPGIGSEVLCKASSHPLKEIRRQAGKLAFSYEADVLTWSNMEFNFSYAVSSKDISAGLLLQSPPVDDLDQREMFCIHLHTGNHQTRKVFRRKVVFVIDTSASMKGKPLEAVKSALSAALSKLSPEDLFSIIAFNGETYLFSSSLVPATKETIENATQWISINFIAEGGTNILLPLNQAIDMLSGASETFDSMPLIFLVTDGTVEDEKHICDVMKSHMKNKGSMSPRISTFGIGTYCNHYFLQMLAQISRGYYYAAYEVDSLYVRMQKLLTEASSIIYANITIDSFDNLHGVEVYPSLFPDLLSGMPLTVSGRYEGRFPDSVKIKGVLADMSNYEVDLKLQQAKDIPLDRVFAKKQIDVLTAQAWYTQSKKLEEKIARMSIQTGIPSEYTRMVVLQIDVGKKASDPIGIQEVNKLDLQKMVDSEGRKIMLLQCLGIGFGNLTATTESIPPGWGEPELPEPVADAFVKAASNCCSSLADLCCCMNCIRCCSSMNNQCGILIVQLCGGLACLGCFSCCGDD
ncbi:hypothetical protein MKW98_012745 [Papaver atlanticum]|uniref:VWFA domain-containing protein n=1 Tax=Papaver atlanticum TaxID=357466 RepID=A0AAD4T1S9_9MAGN|nr:hypothetical protein MKW98_012745 [Papaver atlanticum]